MSVADGGGVTVAAVVVAAVAVGFVATPSATAAADVTLIAISAAKEPSYFRLSCEKLK